MSLASTAVNVWVRPGSYPYKTSPGFICNGTRPGSIGGSEDCAVLAVLLNSKVLLLEVLEDGSCSGQSLSGPLGKQVTQVQGLSMQNLCRMSRTYEYPGGRSSN